MGTLDPNLPMTPVWVMLGFAFGSVSATVTPEDHISNPHCATQPIWACSGRHVFTRDLGSRSLISLEDRAKKAAQLTKVSPLC
jgi:hypothetical protein